MDETLKSQMAESAVQRLFGENKNRTLQLLTVINELKKVLAEHRVFVQSVASERTDHAAQIGTFSDIANRLADVVDYHEQNMSEHLPLMEKTREIIDAHDASLGELKDTIAQVKGMKPKKGDRGNDATPVDVEALIEQVVGILKEESPEVPIQEPLDMDALYTTFVARLQAEKAIDVSHIRNGQQFIVNGKKYKTEELMHGSGSSSGSNGTAVYNEVVAGSGTSWTLPFAPSTGTLRLYANGQRLMVGTDYSLSGTAITTVDSWVAGTLLADYDH